FLHEGYTYPGSSPHSWHFDFGNSRPRRKWCFRLHLRHSNYDAASLLVSITDHTNFLYPNHAGSLNLPPKENSPSKHSQYNNLHSGIQLVYKPKENPAYGPHH